MTYKPDPVGPLQVALGAVFRQVRKKKKVSLKPLSMHLACSINTIRWHEAGARSMRADDLVKAAAFLEVSPAELVTLPVEAP